MLISRREFIGCLALIGCKEDEIKPMKASRIFASFINSVDYLDQHMDLFNFQSDSASNFTIISGTKVSQWNDLSGTGRHITQTTDSRRPLYNGGAILFDGSDDVLELASQLQASTFSFYAVVKSTSTATQAITGGTTSNYVGKNTSRTLALDNSGNGGGNLRYQLYGDEKYQIFSYRRTGTTISIKVNGRELIYLSGTVASANHNFRYFGAGPFGSGSLPWNGTIRALCLSSSYLDDATDRGVLNQLFTKYSLPETSDCLVGFGDSITYGQGATNEFTLGWVPVLAAALGKGVKNYGIGSTTCSNVAGSSRNGQDRWDVNLVERPYSDTVCILYGTNDISAGGVYTADTYESALIEIVSGLLAAGYSANKICIGTVPYRLNDAFASTIAQYNAKIATITTTYGLKGPANVYANMKAVGNSTLVDSVHPSDTGHSIIASAFQTALA